LAAGCSPRPSARPSRWARRTPGSTPSSGRRGFYLKHGYEEYARIDDYAPGFYLAYMKKSLPS
jgi:hypothetical protein